MPSGYEMTPQQNKGGFHCGGNQNRSEMIFVIYFKWLKAQCFIDIKTVARNEWARPVCCISHEP